MRTRDELVAALAQLGWQLVDAPARTPGGYKATIARGNTSKMTTGKTELAVLEGLLRMAEEEGSP